MGGSWRWEPAEMPSVGGRDQEAGGHGWGGGAAGVAQLSLDSGQSHHETGGQPEAGWAAGTAQPQDKTCHTLAPPCPGDRLPPRSVGAMGPTPGHPPRPVLPHLSEIPGGAKSSSFHTTALTSDPHTSVPPHRTDAQPQRSPASGNRSLCGTPEYRPSPPPATVQQSTSPTSLSASLSHV